MGAVGTSPIFMISVLKDFLIFRFLEQRRTLRFSLILDLYLDVNDWIFFFREMISSLDVLSDDLCHSHKDIITTPTRSITIYPINKGLGILYSFLYV